MRRVVAISISVLATCVACAAIVLIMRPPFARPVIEFAQGALEEHAALSDEELRSASVTFDNVGDTVASDEEAAAEVAERIRRIRTPLVAQVEGVDLRCPICAADLTGIVFHQASFDYALVLSTQLPEADYERVANERSMRINRDEQEGDWLDAEALHLWRTGDATAMDTSIDIGALPGTVVRSPISGTVVLVKDYLLYDEVPDIEIHIQPDGKRDLDCVLIHTCDTLVSAGDRVEAGVTELCHVRDIEKDLTDVQLSFFTPEGVGGNHVHVQVNDATTPDYRKKKLKGAFEVR